MIQKYKIFINDTPVYLCDRQAIQNPGTVFSDSDLCLYCPDSGRLRQIIEMVETSDTINSVHVVHKSLGDLHRQFLEYYEPIDAAGGVVVNDKKELLLIFRNGKWDLPKGKVEPGEQVIAAAKREVAEETNVSLKGILDHLPSSFHTYLDKKGRRKLKTTYWFLMKLHSDLTMSPQKEEGIEKVIWADGIQLENCLENTWKSIEEVIEQAQKRLI